MHFIYQQSELVAEDEERLVYRGHFSPVQGLYPNALEGGLQGRNVPHRWLQARWIHKGKRKALRFYKQYHNGTFPVTLILKKNLA